MLPRQMEAGAPESSLVLQQSQWLAFHVGRLENLLFHRQASLERVQQRLEACEREINRLLEVISRLCRAELLGVNVCCPPGWRTGSAPSKSASVWQKLTLGNLGATIPV